MKLPRDLSGDELVATLIKHWEYLKIHQVGTTSSCKQISQLLIVLQFQYTRL